APSGQLDYFPRQGVPQAAARRGGHAFFCYPGAGMTRSLPFSLPRPSWWKRLGFAVFLLAGIAVCWAGSGLALWLQVSCCGVLLVVGAMLLRQTRGEIFGPVLIFDLLRTGRQRRYFVLRGLYALALFLIILWVYRGWTVEQDGILGIRRTAAFA